jgi:hypothetical protein
VDSEPVPALVAALAVLLVTPHPPQVLHHAMPLPRLMAVGWLLSQQLHA